MPCSLTFLVLPRGPPIPTIAASCFSAQAFQAAIPSCIFVRRTSSEREFQAAIRGLVLLPRKIARKVSFVLMLSTFLRAEVYGSVQSVHDNLSLCHRRLIKLNPHLVQSHTAGDV